MGGLFNWSRAGTPELSEAQQFLLSLFLRPRSTSTVTDGGWGQQWTAVLGEAPARTIDRLSEGEYLRPATTAEALSVVHDIDSLKQALRSRGLRVSGRKAELIERLLAADPQRCEADIRGHHILACSALGAEIGERYERERTERREAAAREAFDNVRRRRFDEAAHAIRLHNDREVLLPGLGFSAEGTEAVHRETLHHLFAGGLPKIVGPIRREAGEQLLIAGAMALLGVEKAHQKFLPPGFVSGSRLSDEAAVRMITFAAMHRRNMAQLRDLDVTHVRIGGAGGGSCEACAALRGQSFALHEAPELPYAGCTCDAGCRCRAMPAL